MSRKPVCRMNQLCYVCGLTATKERSGQRHNRFQFPWIKDAYHKLFPTKFDDHKDWAPDSLCTACYHMLRHRIFGKTYPQKFLFPVTWRECTDHDLECHACNSNLNGLTKTTRLNVEHYHFEEVELVHGKRRVTKPSNATMFVPYVDSKHDDPKRKTSSKDIDTKDETIIRSD